MHGATKKKIGNGKKKITKKQKASSGKRRTQC